MHGAVDLDLIFPVKGPVSAKLMWLKADCLHRAGIIDAGERLVIRARCLSEGNAPRTADTGVAPGTPVTTA